MQKHQGSNARHSLKTINKKSPQRDNFFEDYTIFTYFFDITRLHNNTNRIKIS